MPKNLHGDPRVHVESDQERGAGAPGVLDSDVTDSRFPAPFCELPVEVARLIGRTTDAGEYETWVLPGARGAALVGGLALSTQLERGQADIRQRKNGSGAWCFGLTVPDLMARLLELLPDMDLSGIEVDIWPSEPECFATAQTENENQHVGRIHTAFPLSAYFYDHA